MLKCGGMVEAQLHDQLVDIMKQKSGSVYSDFPEGTFGRQFWEQQLCAATASNPRQVRWHPLIIRWCINLKLISSAAYHGTRTTGSLNYLLKGPYRIIPTTSSIRKDFRKRLSNNS